MRYLTLFIIGLLVGCQSCITQNLDTTPYQTTTYYQQSKKQIVELPLITSNTNDTVQVGWAKINITPPYPVAMAGYGKRKGKKYEQVHDSVWVRAFVFKKGNQKAAWVTADLLIMPMSVTEQLLKTLVNKGYTLNNTYLTATHTHYSYGGWGKKLAGRIMAGKYNKNLVNNTAEAIEKAITQAEKTAAPTAIGYQEIPATAFVYNRLVGQKGDLDTLIRVMHFRKTSGEKALICTFAAHPTSVASNDLRLSAEYPGALVQLLEKQMQLDIAAFGAGAVGSHGPQASGDEYTKVSNLAMGLADKIQVDQENVSLAFQTNLRSAYFPVSLNKPQWRLGEKRFRPWLFYTVFGKYPAGLSLLQVGPISFIGTPCDFSGELLPEITTTASARNQKLIVTSFNGSYIGYVTPEKYFSLKKYETRDMNFFGPYTGTYLVELIKLIIQRTNE
ncbi:neutral/alkaline non-lysosomal ceramidase N-terminal domain-containing protein [Adhaeribacter radiodurans]|uniref:Neutral ceramidase n=1 Tax=Adhaeribacter radiodurans TaxID=2745197 RepID=A0A7L7LB15_9BACT|nr:neutral/alkaline non-lysosomal ceramidase N-terminal domain-containing protein [Adhaeribacter radiodurans]QMU29745.1 neutral/alkaline non-lysosomal ceramidase N-terminal domain-containing protein [Adhaeribacter radiodurans]